MNDQTQTKEQEKQNLIAAAQHFLEADTNKPEDILALARQLNKHDEFGWARDILVTVSQDINDNKLKTQIAQQKAFATYKDTHLNRKQALDQALHILQQELDLAKTVNQETLGIAGAIYKRKWETDGFKVYLEQSLIYYQRGLTAGIEGDDAYTAINAAYILDLLAYQEQKQSEKLGEIPSSVAKRREQATQIREQVIASLSNTLNEVKLGKQHYWSVVTLAEAYFGTQNYHKAGEWLNKTLKFSEIPAWEYQTTARQLVHLAKLQADSKLPEIELEKTQAWKTLNQFLGDNATALCSMYRGKVGLALSGGGFRSALYHIGVLARLAELDLLRHIEVMSCVSGGSIVGAHYYLELRRLINIENKKDGEIDRDDYVRLVQKLADDFLAGVQENPRVRLVANPWTNLKMIFASCYTRTQRLGELYEELIFNRVEDGEEASKRWLTDLFIYPEGNQNFLPRRDNWSRQCKIPELILNATTLNTGHNWQFTASWMGESPSQIDPDVDSNDRYRRTYYKDAPDPHKKIRLGSAVSASSCVPGLFEPLIFQGLYKNVTVRLIDGGIYDNQGVSSLIEQDCNIIISSDAAGQMNTDKDPGGGSFAPLLRTNRTLMLRVRGSQYQDLKARSKAGILKGFAYVHLKQGLKGKNVEWADSNEAKQLQHDPNAKTPYGIRQDIQELLSAMRTDLDSFSDIEAYALMTSGYCAIEKPVQEYLQDFPLSKASQAKWKFLQVEAAMKQDEASGAEYARLKTNLQASSMTIGKVWKLDKTLNTVIKAAAGLLVLVLAYLWFNNPGWQPFSNILNYFGETLTIDLIMEGALLLLLVNLLTTWLGAQQAKAFNQLLNFRDIPRRILVGGGIGLVGWIGAFIHLHIFDKIFKKIGKME